MTEKNNKSMIKNYSNFLMNNKKTILINLLIAFAVFFVFESTKIDISNYETIENLQENMNINWFTLIGTVFIFLLPVFLIGNLQSSISKNKNIKTALKTPIRLKSYVYSFFPMFLVLVSLTVSLNVGDAIIGQEVKDDLWTSINSRGSLIEELQKPETSESQKEIILNDISNLENHMIEIFPTLEVVFLTFLFVLLVFIPSVLFSNIYGLMFDKEHSMFQDFKKSFIISKSNFWKTSGFLLLSFVAAVFCYYFTISGSLILKSFSNSLFYVIITTSLVFTYNNFKKIKVEEQNK